MFTFIIVINKYFVSLEDIYILFDFDGHVGNILTKIIIIEVWNVEEINSSSFESLHLSNDIWCP